MEPYKSTPTQENTHSNEVNLFGRDKHREFVSHPLTRALEWSFPSDVAQLSLFGHSRAAEATGFVVPELAWSLDAGILVHTQRPDFLFVTHTHTDHVHELAHVKSRRKPPTIFVPEHAVGLVEDFFQAAQALTDNRAHDPERSWTTAYHLVGVKSGDTLALPRGKRKFSADVFSCDHSVPTVGYCFFEHRSKLKECFLGLPGPEIASLRKDGVEINEETRIPLFAFLGDTTPEVFARHPEILKMPVILMECTFLDAEAHAEVASKTKHTLWRDLEGVIATHPECLFLLAHFSFRYTEDEIRSFFECVDLHNVIPWISPQPIHK